MALHPERLNGTHLFMTPCSDQFKREEALFHAASEINSPDERMAFLKHECGGDYPLRERIEALLGAESEARQFFRTPGEKPTQPEPAQEELGRIGPYRLVERIGEGGFGTVYVADQTRPVRRMVALKVIKPGMDTREVIARFNSERQALALMDHPNIAKVLEAGATEEGRPYFVMELVLGTRITDYCEQNQLSTIERVKLGNRVCQAIQHAHQKGIIHRDIKPSKGNRLRDCEGD